MDKEPELPPRPSESSVEKSKSSFMAGNNNLFRLTSAEAELWDFVPPVPEDDNNDTLSTSNNNFNSTLLPSIHNNNRHNQHKNNILYDLNVSNDNNNFIQRPNNLFKTSNRLSASSEQISPTKNRIKHHLIDWNSSNKNNNNNNNSNSNNSLFDQNGNSHNNSRRCQSLIPNSNLNINFQLNPLYHNSNPNSLNNNMNNNNYTNQNDNNNLYANLYWPLKTTSSSLPVTSPLTSPQTINSPPPFFNNNFANFQPFRMIPNNNNNLDDQINQQLIEKIRKTSFKNVSNNNDSNSKNNSKNPHLNVLQPTTIYEKSPEDPKQIINLFDPLAETIQFTTPSFDNNNFIVEHNYVNTNSFKNNENNSKKSSNSSTLSSSLPSPVNKKVEDIVNNNNISNNDYRNSLPNKTIFKKQTSEQQLKINSNLFELFKVENRENYNKEFDEFCEHLKSLYMTCFQNKSTSSCDINSGLVYSPRIDIDIEHTDNVNNQSDRLYLYGMANTNNDLTSNNRKSSDISCSQFTDDTNNDENLIIIDVRFHSLVYQKITGQTPNAEKIAPCVKVLDSNYFWFSMKFPVDFDKTVDMIVSHVVYNVAENEDSQVNINDFILKLNGINEFLQPDTLLSSYVYFQNCKKNNKHVILELVDQTSPDFWRPFLRCESDTRNILNDLKLDRILPKNFITNFIGYNASKLNDLIDELNTAYTEFISSIDESFYSKQSKKILIDQIVEKISSLCKFLSNIETSELSVAVEKFQYCYQKYYETSSSPIDLSIEQIRKNFEEAYLFIIQALLNIIQMYSKTFPVAFKLPKINNDKIPKAICFDDDEQNKFVTLKRKRKREISQIMDMFIIHVDVCGQISKKWSQNYPNFAIIVNLFHGFNLIKSRITEKSELYGSSQNDKKLMFNQNLDFDTPIYMLPRETRIEFILVGYRNTSNNKTEMDALATTFCYLYDNDELLMNGSHLLPWNEIKCPPTLSGISFEFDSDKKPIIMRELLENHYQVSHNLDPSASMLVISLAPNLLTNIDYTFPEIKKRKEQMSLNYIIPLNDDISHTNINEDSLYGFHGCNHNLLNSKVIKILQKNPIEQLTNNEKDMIWKDRFTLRTFPQSILKILKSPPSWSCHDLRDIYDFLEELDSGPFKRIFRTKIEALQLLSMDYPDKFVRRTVVKWLNSVSVDELCDYLPQLVQSLRFETSFDSHLIWSLFEFSLMSARFCHYFYWQLKSCLDDFTFGIRCQIYLNSLLLLCGERTQEQFQQQDKICEQFSKISAEIKSKSKDSRSGILKQKLEQVNEHLQSNPTSIPLSPSLFVNGLEINQCSYFNSNSLPLKLVFDSAPPYRLNNIQNNYSNSNCNKLLQIYENKPYWHKIIFKCGDDLRKDMLVMQIISIINRVWFRAGLNLRLIIFGVLNTSDRTGMIEMVSKANTLREIQLEHGLTGNFKHHTIATWLKRHNTNEYDYKIAVENFIHSCAGYLVITYLLGICDRHNDNIMVTTSGNLFHIDFGKFFGDAQMMAGIKRDRVPFVFTADMAFVINEGGRPSKNYQFFIDLCCRCFILVRQNGNFLLSLLALMIRSGVDYLSNDTIQYFHDALMPNLIESEAKVKFNRLIEKALGSFSTQLNFFIHSIAQNFSGSGNGGNSNSQTSEDRQSNFYNNSFPESVYETVVSNNTPDYDELPNLDLNESESCSFSFTKCRVTEAMDGHITSLDIVNFRLFVPEKNEKVYFYKVKVDRQNYPENFVYRSFKEFIELHDKMTKIFPLVKFHTLKRSPMLNRSSRQEIASQRKREIQYFLKNLLQLASEISHSDMVYTFFHPILRDQHFHDVELNPTISTNSPISSVPSVQTVYTRQPKIKLNIGFRDEALHVLVCHVRNLDSDRVTAPDSYVKLYLKPDQNKSTKRKTRVMPKNAHPTFMESFIYPSTWEQLRLKTLEVSVWESDMTGNKRLGQVMIPLQDIQGKIEKWFQLKNQF